MNWPDTEREKKTKYKKMPNALKITIKCIIMICYYFALS